MALRSGYYAGQVMLQGGKWAAGRFFGKSAAAEVAEVGNGLGSTMGAKSALQAEEIVTSSTSLINNGKKVASNVPLNRQVIKKYLNEAGNLNRHQISEHLTSIGLKLKGKSPDSKFMSFVDKYGDVRVKIHPSDKVTKYNHLHIYNRQGQSLDANLNIVSPRASSAHIRIKE